MVDNNILTRYFPHQYFPKGYGQLTYIGLYDTELELQNNASKVPTALEGRGGPWITCPDNIMS